MSKSSKRHQQLQQEAIARLIALGISLEQIPEVLGVSVQQVQQVLDN